MRFVKYFTTTLEKNYKYQIHTEPDLGIPIDLIDPDAYKSKGLAKIDPEDLQLINPLENGNLVTNKSPKLRPAVHWLQKTTYIASYNQIPKIQKENIESKAGWNKKNKDTEEVDQQRETQIKLIEGTFEAARKLPKHPNDPTLQPLEIRPVLPDIDLWSNSYVRMVFNAEPAISNTQSIEELEYLKSEAIIKGLHAGDVPFLAYSVPKKKKKRRKCSRRSRVSMDTRI